jgi:hypothetical protein
MARDKVNIKKNKSYNVLAITAISRKLNISEQYVRQCVKGDRKSINADYIKKEYLSLVKKIENLLL